MTNGKMSVTGSRRHPRAGGAFAAGLALGAIMLLFSVAFASPAFGAFDHSTVETEFTVPDCGRIIDVDVDEMGGYVYVSCMFNPSGGSAIKRFDLNGNPVNFPFHDSYLTDNEIIQSPSNTTFANDLGFPHVAIDNSGGTRQGYLFVSGGDGVGGQDFKKIDVFKSSGEWTTALGSEYGTGEERIDVDVLPNGHLLTLHSCCEVAQVGTHITEYDDTLHPKRRIYYLLVGDIVRGEAGGGVFLKTFGAFSGGYRISKYEADQWSTNLGLQGRPFNGDAQGFLLAKAHPSPLFADPIIEGPASNFYSDENGNFDVDISRNDIYVNRGDHVDVYSGGTADEPPHQNAPSFGVGKLTETAGIAVMADNRVYVSSATNKVVRFGPGNVLPDVFTPEAQIDDVGHTSATVSGHIELAGGTNITSCQVEYAPQSGAYGGPGSGTAGCTPDPAVSPPGSNFSTATNVSATLSGLTMGSEYRYRVKAGNAQGANVGIDRAVVPAYVLKVNTLSPTGIDEHGATLAGSFEPDSATTYHFEYGADTTYGTSTPSQNQAASPGVVPVGAPISGLPSGRTFHYRLVASNVNGTTVGKDKTFTTASPPDLEGVFASEVAATSAVLNAKVNPVGYETEYQFEYGTTEEYGQVVPAEPTSVGAGSSPVAVAQNLTGLTPGVTYHFRVVATNQWGSSVSADTTFDFSPPSCPNGHVRQETRATYLPDCRAYELVSPPDAGGVLIIPGQYTWDKELSNIDPYGQGDGNTWTLNTGLASSPARFSFYGGFGSFPGLDAPNNARGTDMYVTTRTTTGWVTTLPGLTGSEALESARKECSETLSLCADHDEGAALFPVPKDHAPYLFTAAGKKVGQFPSNVEVIPDGHNFSGPERWSPDFSHFFFSSTNAVFAPGGVGSAYENDVNEQQVTLISKLPGGEPIPQNGSSTHAIEFPAISADGSHILMETQGSGEGPFRLYLRDTNLGLTYLIANEAPVEFVGMTRDGTTVLFTSATALTGDDTDTSVDLYEWDQATDSLTRLSQGNGEGNVNTCSATWTSACSVKPLSPERLHPHNMRSVVGSDDLIAEESGDVYFYSPENLDPARPGIRNRRNLYVYRDGSVRLVATFDNNTEVNRMQISPDGDHAAMLTAARLTSYDSKGFRQMYAYNAVDQQIRCASCNPTDLPPLANVAASQGGPFMADDGRVFFATKDSLVPRDANGGRIDVYEYVGGRPQLITTGQGTRDNTGGGGGSIFTLSEDIGLESVSADGTDVYFSTYETLTRDDLNGPHLKFYDARTGGGFPLDPELAPCAAADECHGADSSPPAPAVPGSAGNLGSGGNVQPQVTVPKKKSKKGKGKSKKRKRKKSARHARHGRG